MSNLIGRVQNILLAPKTNGRSSRRNRKQPPALHQVHPDRVGTRADRGVPEGTLIGTTLPLVGTFKLDMGTGLTQLALTYCLGLVSVFVVALIINALAPSFSAQKDSVQALKAVAYASTAAWVGGAAEILPWGLGLLIALAGGIYSIYLLYLGLQYTMKAPAERQPVTRPSPSSPRSSSIGSSARSWAGSSAAA